MPFGVPRTLEQRLARHQSIFGADTLPPEIRQKLGPSMSTPAEVAWSWLPASPIGPDGKFQPPLPRWAIVKMRGAGRRLSK